MKQIQLAFAGVVALALSAQAGTSPWWSEDFSSYVDISALTNQVVGVRTAPDDWTTSEGDQSEIVVGAYSNEYASAYYASGDVDLTDVLKLNTEGNDLVFVPRVADGETSSKIVVDADIFFVGSDSAPTGFDDNGDVQFALYLKTPAADDEESEESNVLCAYVYDAEAESGAWTELPGAAIDNYTWHHVQVAIDYAATYKTLKIYVDGVDYSGDNVQIANNRTSASGLTSVSFRGTGAIDNFVGQYEQEAPTYTFEAALFVDGESVESGLSDEVQVGTPAQFWVPLDNEGVKLAKVVVKDLSGEGSDTVYEFSYDEATDEWSVSPESDVVELYGEDGFAFVSAPTDSAPGESEIDTFTLIEVYYGESVEPPPPDDDHVGATAENGIVILDSSDEAAAGQTLEFTSIEIDGATATVGFDAAVYIPDGAETTITLPLLSAQSLDGPWVPVTATVTVTEEGGTAVVNLPENVPALFFKGFTNAEGVIDAAE